VPGSAPAKIELQDPLHAELLVGQSFLRKKLPLDYSFEKTTNLVFQFKDAFPSLYTLYAGASTIGISTATCENSFSTLTRILHPRRRAMTHQRKSQLVRFAFEEKLTRDIDLDKFIQKFKFCGNATRRIVL
jgi:hypothetical protein